MRQITFLLVLLVAAVSLRFQHASLLSNHDWSIHQQIIFPRQPNQPQPQPQPNQPQPNQPNQQTQQNANLARLKQMPLVQARDVILAAVGQGPFVNTRNVYELSDFLGTPMGSTILNYFDHRTVQDNGKKGLNRYNLSVKNFRLWMAIKIISDTDNNMYIRSTTIDKSLFEELIQKGFPQ